jgi:hypothetical protein
MKPLLFLTLKSIRNGFVRAFTTPRRLLPVLFLLLWYYGAFVRGFGTSGKSTAAFGNIKLDSLKPEWIEAFSFGAFGLLSIFMMVSITGYQGSFRPADVDVLFPTPIEPRYVVIFRVVRDYLITLLFPLFFGLMAYRPLSSGYSALKAADPVALQQTLRMATVAWILTSLMFVNVGYAVSIWTNRSDLASERNRKIMRIVIIGFLLSLFAVAFMAARDVASVNDFVRAMSQPILRILLFPATFCTWIVTGAASGQPLLLVSGILLLVGLSVVGYFATARQVGWVYDQAASRGNDATTLRSLQKQGDLIGIAAERARSGKRKVLKETWFTRLRVHGFWALTWKDVLLTWRGLGATIILLAVVTIAVIMMPALITTFAGIPTKSRSLRTEAGMNAFFVAMAATSCFMVGPTMSQVAFVELIRRIDLQKPLPFTPFKVILGELMAKTIVSVVPVFIGVTAASIIAPRFALIGLVCLVASIPVCANLNAVTLASTLLFPDLDDATQRGLRGLVSTLGWAIGLFPSVLVTIAAVAIGAPLPVIVLLFGAFAVVGAWVCMLFAARLYANLNPAE